MTGPEPGPLQDGEGLPLCSLREVNRLPAGAKEALYRQLLPPEVFEQLGGEHRGELRFICPEGIGLLRIEVRRDPGDRDCLFFLELADTAFGQLELSFCLVNDPDGPRFEIDRDPAGRDNCFGTLRRNLAEELRAMRAGLSPHQVRRGLRLFSPFFQRLDGFAARLGVASIVAEPLSYSNAIRYEAYGFDYLTGKQLMTWIDREFQPGGILFRRLDGSTPFREPGMEKTVRGRSWAIHDGILNQPWDGVKIYKIPGRDAGVRTFPGRHY